MNPWFQIDLSFHKFNHVKISSLNLHKLTLIFQVNRHAEQIQWQSAESVIDKPKTIDRNLIYWHTDRKTERKRSCQKILQDKHFVSNRHKTIILRCTRHYLDICIQYYKHCHIHVNVHNVFTHLSMWHCVPNFM